MKRIELALLCALIASIILASFTAFAGECDDVRSQVLRLHVLANSDSEADQALKLSVRDAVLAGTEDIFLSATDKAATERLVEENLNVIADIARDEIHRLGSDYSVKAELVNMFFETRAYGEMTLPAGYYDALRITIGAGRGKNWWCMMFPPMCIPAASKPSAQPLEQQILDLGERPHYVPKFALVELYESVCDKLAPHEEAVDLAR